MDVRINCDVFDDVALSLEGIKSFALRLGNERLDFGVVRAAHRCYINYSDSEESL
jgi:hypothetical protein